MAAVTSRENTLYVIIAKLYLVLWIYFWWPRKGKSHLVERNPYTRNAEWFKLILKCTDQYSHLVYPKTHLNKLTDPQDGSIHQYKYILPKN